MTMPMKTNTGAGLRGGGPGDKIPKGYRKGSMQNFTPEQMQLFSQAMGHVGPDSYTGRMAAGDQSMFEQMEAPAMRQFQGGMGQLASRFSGMGQGGRHSSGFQNQATAATSNFAQDLAARRHDMQRQAINDLMGFSNQLLNQRPNENFLVQKQKKEGIDWGGIGGAALGGLAGFLSPMPGGLMAGASMGYGIGSGKGTGGNTDFSVFNKPKPQGNSGYDFRNEMMTGAGYNY